MRNLIIITFILISCIACKPIIVKEHLMDDLPESFAGKLKKIEAERNLFITNSTSENTTIEYYKNRPIKGIIIYPTNKSEIEFIYGKQSKIMIDKSGQSGEILNKFNFLYDKFGNEIYFDHYCEGKLVSSVTFENDSKGNHIKEVYRHFNSKTEVSSFESEYNYKLKYFITKKVNGNKPYYFKKYFNKKGLIIKDGVVDENGVFINDYSIYNYDKKGNILSVNRRGNNGRIFDKNYKYLFDKKGNIIEREIYLNNKLIDKLKIKITYK
ncbi:hypothetical protein GSF70_15080 [Flavobacteriaceae bacterium W22]|nr:hypothetical protein [Flavobacteriaceae bacterium W22]